MTQPYDHEALWMKAKLFLNRAMENDVRSFDEQAFWASAALELLGKAALARVSPLLIAEPTEEGKNLLIATGLLDGKARFTSVRAKTIFERCRRAFHPFSSAEAMEIANARNEYLHGSGVGVLALPPNVWWPRFWSLALTLAHAQDRDLDELVGEDRVSLVEKQLELNTKNIEHQVETLVNRARQRLAQYRLGTLPAKIQAEWQSNPDLRAGLSFSVEETCPACDGSGLLEGADYDEISYEDDAEWEYDGVSIVSWVELTVPSDHFSCAHCHLILDGYEFIAQAELPTSFSVTDDSSDYVEPEYGND